MGLGDVRYVQKCQKAGSLQRTQGPSLSDTAVYGGRLVAPPLELILDDDEAAIEEGQHHQDIEAPCD